MEMYKNTFSRRSLISDGKLSIQNNGKSFHGQKRFHIEPAQVHSIKKVMWERQFCIAQRSIIFSLNYFQTTAICKTYVLCVDKKKGFADHSPRCPRWCDWHREGELQRVPVNGGASLVLNYDGGGRIQVRRNVVWHKGQVALRLKGHQNISQVVNLARKRVSYAMIYIVIFSL